MLVLLNILQKIQFKIVCNTDTFNTAFKAGKIRFSGERKFVLLKANSGERCAPHNFALLVTLQSKSVCLTVYLTVHQIKYIMKRKMLK